MPYGSSLGVTAPTVSVTPGPDYATQVNAYLAALRAVVEAKVTPGGFNMSTDFSFLSGGTYRSATDLFSTRYTVQAAAISAATYPAAVYFAGVSGDLYVNDSAGNQIRITNSGIVNVSASGGITGSGYGTGGVEINWSSGNIAYRMFSGSGTYADVVCDDVILNDGSGNFITIQAPAMASDYSITLPDAIPGSNNTLMTMSNTSPGVVTNTGTPTVTTLATTGAATLNSLAVTAAATVGTTLGVTGTSTVAAVTASGLITANAGVTAGANQHVTVSGTGKFKYGTVTIVLPATSFQPGNEATTYLLSSGTNYRWTHSTGAIVPVYAPVVLPEGARITSIESRHEASGVAGTRTLDLLSISVVDTGTAATNRASATSTTTSAQVTMTATITGTTHTIAAGLAYTLVVGMNQNDYLGLVIIQYDQP